MEETKQEQEDLKIVVVEKMMGLMTAAFGLIAALAWNDAIQTLFKTVFGDQSGLIAKFIYAAGITVLVIVITVKASRLQEKLKEHLKK